MGSVTYLLLQGVEFGGDETGKGVVLESDGILVHANGFRSATYGICRMAITGMHKAQEQ